jgi:hypothetical protein
MLPGDRLICGFIDEHQAGEQFQTWLLHITIVPCFGFAACSG